MLDIFNRGLLFITNITGHTSGEYNWKSYPVQRNSLATDSTGATRYSHRTLLIHIQGIFLDGKVYNLVYIVLVKLVVVHPSIYGFKVIQRAQSK